MKVRLLDAFAGIGGFHLGVQQACQDLNIDFECVGAIEWDKKCQETYKINFPNVQIWDDITKIDLTTLPNHNLLTGGFPCQPFSMAGKAYKNNMIVIENDIRRNLFLYLIDILKIKQPKYFIFENVKGILNLFDPISNENIVNIILQMINDIGYNTIIKTISPHEIGIPQKRQRVFFIGTLKPNIIKDFTIKYKNQKVLKDILLDNVPSTYNLINRKIWNENGQIRNMSRIDMMYESFCNRKHKHKYNPENTVLAAEINGDTPSGRSRQTNRAYHYNGLSPTLTTVDIKIIYDLNNTFRYLTEKEYARLQGFIENFKIHLNSNIAYRQFGNAVCVDIVQYIIKEIYNVF